LTTCFPGYLILSHCQRELGDRHSRDAVFGLRRTPHSQCISGRQFFIQVEVLTVTRQHNATLSCRGTPLVYIDHFHPFSGRQNQYTTMVFRVAENYERRRSVLGDQHINQAFAWLQALNIDSACEVPVHPVNLCLGACRSLNAVNGSILAQILRKQSNQSRIVCWAI
jgi:hypothetical protein